MRYYFQGVERLQFFGLNPNETACVIIYLVCVLWVAEKSVKKIKWLIPLFAAEFVALLCLARTISRGGLVAVLIVAAVAGFLHGRRIVTCGGSARSWPSKQKEQLCVVTQRIRNLKWRDMVNGFVAYPIWRVPLLAFFPSIWGRMAPAYMANDASVGNRFALWKGALKLYSGSFSEGWGLTKTGQSYMNWIQPLHDRLEYNGLVNSFLQICVGFGGLILTFVLFFLALGLVNSYALLQKSRLGQVGAARRTGCSGFGETALPDGVAKYSKIISSLCLLWTITWIVCSLFSTMLRSSLQVWPVILSIILTFILCKPKPRHILISLGIALSFSIGLYVSGAILTINSSFSIIKKNGIVYVINKSGLPRKACVFYVDECALGDNYGKQIRRYMEAKGISKCAVIDNVDSRYFAKLPMDQSTVLVLSGDIVSAINLDGVKGQVIFLYPHCNARETSKSRHVRQILFPEMDPFKYRYLWQAQPLWAGKIQLIPYDSAFKITWADYITDI